MRGGSHIGIALAQQGADGGAGEGRQVHNAQVGQGGLLTDNAGDNQGTAGNDGADGIGEDMPEHQPEVRGAQGTGSGDKLLTLEPVELLPGQSGHAYPADKHEGEGKGTYHAHFSCQMQLEQGGNHNKGHTAEDVHNTVHNHIHHAAVVTLNGTVESADGQVNDGNQDGEQQREPGTHGHSGEQVLTHGVGTEDEAGLVTVQILVVVVVAHTGLNSAGLGNGVDIAAVVALNPQGVVGCALNILVGGVHGHQLAVIVQNCCALAVHLIPNVGVVADIGNILGLYIGVDDLDAGLILPGLNLLKFCIGEYPVNHTNFIVAVHFQIVGLPLYHLATVLHIGGMLTHHPQHRIVAGFLGDALPVVHGNIVLAVVNLGTVQNAPALFRNGGYISRIIDIQRVLLINAVRCQHGSEQGEQNQKQQNPGCHHRGLILTEPKHGIGKKAPGLGFQLGIVELCPHLDKGKLFLGDLFKVVIFHFLDPILIRGSIKP